jgi:hypothetical protein
MLRKLVLVALFAMFLAPAAAKAQFDEGDWEMFVAGSGASDSGFDNTSLSATLSIGYFFNDNLEAGVRQGITFVDTDAGGSDFAGSTAGFVDYHFDLDRWQPFIGAFIGYVYGDGVNDDGTYGPEGGVKYFVNSTTFIFVMCEYQFFFENDSNSAGEAFSDGQFVYTLGLGFRW